MSAPMSEQQLRARVAKLESQDSRVRTDELAPGDRVWHPYEMACFTVTRVAPDGSASGLRFHNRATDSNEFGLRVTGTDDSGETAHVDCAPSYLWTREDATAELAGLRAQLSELADRARRVAVSHEHFIQDHSDSGAEALASQYELINWLARSEHHEGLPLNPAENALRIILAELDENGDEVNARWIRGAIAEALPRKDMSDRRRRIYVDAHGDGWIDQSVEQDGTKWLVQLSSMAVGGSEPMHAVAKRTGSLREIGRCW
ncbi:hypothetical protein [Streptomyces sp. NPDC004330]|uniref:hypothetical protein n=1 Tax=Streptomyces sp. NPDC004330 TaxID=3364700 RepID=UPI00369EB402